VLDFLDFLCLAPLLWHLYYYRNFFLKSVDFFPHLCYLEYMKTYQFESIIEDNGVIALPEDLKNLKKHRVKLIVVDLEPSDNPLNMLDKITQKYAAVSEEDLDITGIYEQREQHHDRGIVFD
jgi:hypothetical protein